MQPLHCMYAVAYARKRGCSGSMPAGHVCRLQWQRSLHCGHALQGVSTQHLLDGDTPVIGTSENFTKPGIYTLEVPCPKTRSTATIHLEMWDENKITFVDDFSLSFHMHFEKLLKWLVALPFTLAAIVLIGLKGNSATHALPSFSRTDGLLSEP